MNKYRATSYSHGAPATAGKPLRSIVFRAANYFAARTHAERELSVGREGVIGIKVER